MRLVVHCSFEPASLERLLAHWNARIPLFEAIDVRRPEALGWGLVQPGAAAELHVFALDDDAVARELSGEVPAAFVGSQLPPILVTLPSLSGRAAAASRELRCDLVDGNAVFAAAGITEPRDTDGYQIAGIPYRESAYVALATAIVRRAHARLAPEPKVIAIDCDGTLWQGLCAEVGPDGIVIGPGERELHAFLLAQKRAGRVLALVSKNVPEDVEAVFARRADMGLSRDDFVATKVSWRPKSVALRELADELSLGLDAFVFLDDSPAECAEVKAALPEVVTLLREPEAPAAKLRAAWLLDIREAGGLGEERTRMYREEAQRRGVHRDAASFEDYVQGLAVVTEVRPARGDESARVFELAQRTNQFNTSGVRPSSSEVAERVGRGEVLSIHVRDRFGDYGLTGALFVRFSGASLEIDRWLLSCRVLGRGVEAEVFDAVAAYARAGGASRLEVPCAHLPRNSPAQAAVRAFAGSILEETDAGFRAVADLATQGPAPRTFTNPTPVRETAHRSTVSAPDWDAIADLTRSPKRLAAAVGVSLEESNATPLGSGHEAVLAVLAEVMGRPVTTDDNLYALGADSLRMMRILARLRGRLGLDLPVGEILYRADVAHLLALAAHLPERAVSEARDEAFLAAFRRELYDDADPAA